LHPLFVPRFLLFVEPALALLVAMAIVKLRRVAAATVLVVVVALNASALRTHFTTAKPDWRDATRYMAQNSRPDDAVVFFLPLGRMPFAYYCERQHACSGLQTIFPAHGAGITRRDFEGVLRVAQDAVAQQAGRYSCIWLVISEGTSSADAAALQTQIGSDKHLVETREFSGVTIDLFSAQER
jgi:hypothetical protein